ncbi:MAG: redox-regulated ATPase YchF [Candidatus Pacearchaeota archaeon]
MLIGLVGKPNCGKSTFFKACTLAEVLIANYPFATIKPNEGVGYVKVDCIDKEFKVKCMPRTGFCINGKRFVPIKLLDVAGLVPGAHKGKGLGNQFLDDLRQADVFIHIVDLSGKTNEEGKPAENYDVTKDIVFLEDELDFWFFGLMEKAWKSFVRKAQAEKIPLHEAIAKQFSGLKINDSQVKEAILASGLNPETAVSWTSEELLKFTKLLRKISKPMLIAANKCDTPTAKENLKKLKEKFPDLLIIPCSAESELALREAARDGLITYIPGENHFEISNESKISERQKKALEFIQKNVLDVYGSTGVQEVLNKAVFELLKYIAVFPAGAHKLADREGNILPDCFLLPPNSTALDFAYTVHTDLGKNFIKAIDARTKKILSKEYKLKNRDAIEIVT